MRGRRSRLLGSAECLSSPFTLSACQRAASFALLCLHGGFSHGLLSALDRRQSPSPRTGRSPPCDGVSRRGVRGWSGLEGARCPVSCAEPRMAAFALAEPRQGTDPFIKLISARFYCGKLHLVVIMVKKVSSRRRKPRAGDIRYGRTLAHEPSLPCKIYVKKIYPSSVTQRGEADVGIGARPGGTRRGQLQVRPPATHCRETAASPGRRRGRGRCRTAGHAAV